MTFPEKKEARLAYEIQRITRVYDFSREERSQIIESH